MTPIRIDPAARRAWHGNQMLSLGQREYNLLAHLINHPGPAPFEHLTHSIYGEPLNDRTRRMVQELAAAVRRKLGDTPPYKVIVSVRGVGYELPRTLVAPAVQRVEIDGVHYDVVQWARQPCHGATEVFTLYARPAEVPA